MRRMDTGRCTVFDRSRLGRLSSRGMLLAPGRDALSLSWRNHLLGHDFYIIDEVVGEIHSGRHKSRELQIVVDDEADVMCARLEVDEGGERSWLFARSAEVSSQLHVEPTESQGTALSCFSQGRECYTVARRNSPPIGRASAGRGRHRRETNGIWILGGIRS